MNFFHMHKIFPEMGKTTKIVDIDVCTQQAS